jgi:Na+:H+ antiporter, NhaA family
VPTRHPPCRVPGALGRARSPPPGRALREFLDTEAAGGLVLLVAHRRGPGMGELALASGLRGPVGTKLTVQVGRWTLALDLRHWANDGLMAPFLFVVGLEIKRELVAGELRSLRNAALPAGAWEGVDLELGLLVGGGDAGVAE